MRRAVLFMILLLASTRLFSQAPVDSTFSLFFNGGLSFTHANDPHINRWLAKYGYPTEPHVPSSLHFELSAMPVNSRQMYSARVSVINSGKDLTSFNLLIGMYSALIKDPKFLLLAGAGVGFHRDIIALNGNMPPEYKQLANSVNRPLGLRRGGLIVEPALRALWFPLNIHQLQLGLFAGAGIDMDFNSRWRLGYFDNSQGKASHFKRLTKPSDQQRVSEYGLAYNAGLTFRLHLL
ncbi:MAG TPA: hypothetical protein VHC48_10450 [Puia sp.]|nr:hypothetical protein [Puia sp.]